MTDARLRELERAAMAGDAEAGARLLRARERAGERSGIRCIEVDNDPLHHVRMHGMVSRRDLDCGLCGGTGYRPLRHGIELAAYCKDDAARLVIGESCSCGIGPSVNATTMCLDEPGGFSEWLKGLSRWGREAQVRAAVAVARAAQVEQCYERNPTCTRTRCTPILHVIEAIEAFVEDPCEEHHWNMDRWSKQVSIPEWLWNAIQTAICEHSDRATGHDHLIACVRDSRLTESRTRAAICAALIPWALGIMTDKKPED